MAKKSTSYGWVERQIVKPVSVDFLTKFQKSRSNESNKLAYLAGIVDGEGYVKVEKWGTIRLAVGMTDKETPFWLYKTYGGTLSYVNKHRTDRKNVWVWRLNKPLEILKLFILMSPFLLVKRKKVYEALQLLLKRLKKQPQFHTLRRLKLNMGVH